MRMARNEMVGLGVVCLFVASMIFKFWFESKNMNKLMTNLNAEYPELEPQSGIDKTVTNIVHPLPGVLRNSQNHAFVIFDDSVRARINASRELSTDTLTLDDVLKIGDRVKKESNTKMFIVYRINGGDTLKYAFELRYVH